MLGLYSDEYSNRKYHEIPIQANNIPDESGNCMTLAGLYFDPQSPERQDVMIEKLIYSSPLLDLDKEETAGAARLSVFMNEVAMEQLIEIVHKAESSVASSKGKKALQLL